MTEQAVERLILATPDLQHRAALVTAYGAGLCVSETVAVKIGDIKSDRKCLHIPSGKGGMGRMNARSPSAARTISSWVRRAVAKPPPSPTP